MALREASETPAEFSGQAGTSKKSKNPKETTIEASEEGSAALRVRIKAELKQALEDIEEATMKCDKAAEDMFQLYANLLYVNARYVWNKIVYEQTKANPYTDPQGLTRKGPRGMLRKSFEDCVMFHLLTVFPNNAAEQERYYITNVLKKTQRVSNRQFVQHVEQFNSYILQLLCWYYSPSVKTNTIPMNLPFAEADLSSHVLLMCPYAWQDQYNLHEKGGTPVDMRSLLLSLEAIKRVCGREGSNKSNPSCDNTARRRVRSNLVLTIVPESQRRYVPRNTAACARNMGAHTRRTILAIAVVSRKTEQKNPISALLRKVERNPIP